MVRLKAKRLKKPKLRKSRFNSTMVRLKAMRKFYFVASTESFNSTMVRLKATVDILAIAFFVVSIPLWFD